MGDWEDVFGEAGHDPDFAPWEYGDENKNISINNNSKIEKDIQETSSIEKEQAYFVLENLIARINMETIPLNSITDIELKCLQYALNQIEYNIK